MITLNHIRELVLSQEKELENLIAQYVSQDRKCSIYNNVRSQEEIKSDIEIKINDGDFKAAKNILDNNVDLFEGDISLYSIRGTIALYENDLEEALDNFLKGLEIDKYNTDILYNMGYLNTMIGNNEEAIYFYSRCIESTSDDNLKNEIYNLIENLDTYKPYTLIALDFDNNHNIFNSLDKEKNTIINIIPKEDEGFENKYYQDGITICETSYSKYIEMISYFIRRNENVVLIYNNFETKKLIDNIDESVGTIYIPKKNYYTDKTNYINHSMDMNEEKDICNFSNLIITEDINIYNYKKIIEKRNNVYFIEESANSYLSLDNLLGNMGSIDNKKINEYIKICGKKIGDEYLKAMYIIASEVENIDNCIELSKYIYEKYNTEESYHIYLNLLKNTKDYNTLVSIIIDSKYCDDVYKAEIIYLNAIGKFELLDFIIDIITKNYRSVELTSDDYIDYKMALYNFELNLFDTSYEKYLKVIEIDDKLCNSPIVNRNTSYLMYAMGNDNYESYYKLYKELVKDFLS